MDYDLLWKIGEQVRRGERLTSAEKHFIAETAPQELTDFPRIPFPSRVQHPAGFSISGAPVRTLTRCVLVLTAQRVLGPKYDARSDLYGRVAEDLAFGIMRSHFHHGYPKGTYCCARCSLAVYPVLKAKAFRWFDCRPLEKNVRQLVEEKEWRFTAATNPGMIAWALA